MSFVVVIPARYASMRLPGKPLIDFDGKPMAVRVAEQATASGAQRAIVATDDERVREACAAHGCEVVMTSAHHTSGTERIAEVVTRLNFTDETIVVNVQGDEPLMPPVLIRMVGEALNDAGVPMATAC